MRKTVVKDVVFVFVMGLEGTGHHFYGSLFKGLADESGYSVVELPKTASGLLGYMPHETRGLFGAKISPKAAGDFGFKFTKALTDFAATLTTGQQKGAKVSHF